MSNQVITFRLGGQTYCVPILSVREVRGIEEPSPVPFSRPYVKGAINLRGVIMMIVDLAGYFGVRSTETPKNIIIVEDDGSLNNGERRQCGLIVDSVVEMPNIDISTLQPANANDSLSGMIIIDEEMVGFVNLNAILKKALS